MLKVSRLFGGVSFGFLNSGVYLVVFWWFCCFWCLSHKVIGIRFTTENSRNFREFENNSKLFSPGFITVLGEPEDLVQKQYICIKIFTFNSVYFFKSWMVLVLWSFYSICIMVMYLFAWHSWNFKEKRITQDKVIDFSNLLVLNLLPFWSKELHVYLIAEAEQQDTAWDVWALISLPRCQVIPCAKLMAQKKPTLLTA